MLTQASFYKATLIALVIGMACACSSMVPYKNSSPANMTISTDVRRGAAQLHVYGVDTACNMNYQGTVDLSGQNVKIALPTNKPIILVIDFTTNSLFTGSSRNSYSTYLTLRTGYHYEALVSYVDNMYGATLYEQETHGGKRKIPHANLPCASK